MIKPDTVNLGQLNVARLLPSDTLKTIGPWVFFDHFGPVDFPPGAGIDVRPHPHINLGTVTYLFTGEILHRDSLGTTQTIVPGAVNLMIAGRGIVHSERETQTTRQKAHSLHGLQLWHALPEAVEEMPPSFTHYPASQIPQHAGTGFEAKIILGTAFGITSPVQTFFDTIYLDLQLKAGAQLSLPFAAELGLYVIAGAVEANQILCKPKQMLFLAEDCSITALEDTRLIVIGGEPCPKRHLFWNFVSSSKSRIEQATLDWQQGNFPEIPEDNQEYISLP